jgi:hypothetical protein
MNHQDRKLLLDNLRTSGNVEPYTSQLKVYLQKLFPHDLKKLRKVKYLGKLFIQNIDQWDICQLLLYRGADLNYIRSYIKDYLSNRFPDINLSDSNQLGELLLEHIEDKRLVAMLIFLEANVNYQDQYGQNPLEEAIFNEDQNTSQMLIDFGADFLHSKIDL